MSGQKNKLEKRRVFSGVIIGILALIAFGAWAVSSPAGSSPDDDYHLISIWCSTSADGSLCTNSTDDQHREVSIQLTNISCFAYHPETSASCQENIIGQEKFVTTDRGNFTGEYPPVFYAANHLFASNDVESSVIAMRFFNLSIFIASSFLLYLFLMPRIRKAFVVTWAISIVPLGMFIIASTNPSSWAITGIVNGIFSLIGFLVVEDKTSKIRLAILYGVFLLLALGSRPDAAVYAGMFAVILSFVFWKRSTSSPFWLPGTGLAISMVVFLLSRQNVVSTSSSLSTATGEAAEQVISRNPVGVLGFNLLQLPELFAGSLGTGGLGWLDTRMPGIVWVPCLAVFAATVFYFLRKQTVREAIGTGLIALALVAIPLVVLQLSLSRVGENVQPRYVYPLLIGLAALVVTLGLEKGLQLGLGQLIIIGISVTVANSIALYTNMSRYIQGQGWGTNWNLNVAALDGWWDFPIGPMFVWLLGSIGFAGILIFLLWAQLKESRVSFSAAQ